MSLIADITLYVFTFSFLSGLIITAINGSFRAIKIYLIVLSILSFAALVIGVIASGGLLIFLLFQIITLVLVISFFIITGAAAGSGIYYLIHHQSAFNTLSDTEIDDYLSLEDFSALENISEEKIRARVKSKYYQGGKNKDILFVHKSELTRPKDKMDQKAKPALKSMEKMKSKN